MIYATDIAVIVIVNTLAVNTSFYLLTLKIIAIKFDLKSSYNKYQFKVNVYLKFVDNPSHIIFSKIFLSKNLHTFALPVKISPS